MKKLDIVITMAGEGSRFKKAGYQVPKYMIEVHGKTLFEWSMLSLKGYQDIVDHYIFVVRGIDFPAEFIGHECEKLGILKHEVIEIDYLTDGQATTALLAKNAWTPNHGLLIYNIDTYVEAFNMNDKELKGDGFIPCFKGQGDHWSFVRLDDGGRAEEVREKVRISDYCTLGAYYFKSCQLYQELYEEYYSSDENLEKGEKYVAPLYNYLIRSKNGSVYISVVEQEKIHVLGTPEELDVFKSSYQG
ncbi:glycosyltransferase family 2 protein [Lacrimispora algidixylanolytica]|uniref:Capsular biosynthesis protein n=1 Tax=Lacrimispora algidixylanolytica TaxID=94868 RepID=A0A419TBK5_9FIRM|nr:glycosyltransferase family 2 protein [Lacrimispora algidixylanolytica]RKD34832.1 hypothetical protein BET01_00250 [Lacrimispora algidixylanolytica]